MTTLWTDDPDAEYDDSENLWGDADADADADFDSEDYDAEARNTRRRRTAQTRARRVALARRRQAAARARAVSRRQPAAAASPQRATAAAVRNLDLETKVTEDAMRSALAAQQKRISRGEYAAVVGAAVNQFIETFEAPDNVYAKAALRFSPLLLLAPQSRGRGVEGLIKDPRVIGAAAIAGLVFFGDHRNQDKKVQDVRISGFGALRVGDEAPFIADVVDGKGRNLSAEKVTWASQNPAVATVTPDMGVVKAVGPGFTVITSSAGGVTGRYTVTVAAATKP